MSDLFTTGLTFLIYNYLTMPELNQDIELRSEEVQEILTKVPNWMIRWGNTLLLVLIIILLSISWFIKYPDVIDTQVMITTTNPPQKLYANSSGKFDVFFIQDNDTVKANTPIAIIENSALYKDVLFLKSITYSIDLDKAEFKFPINDLPPLILGEINASFSQFENNYSNYFMNIELKPFENDNNANRRAVSEAKRRLVNLIDQKRLSEGAYELRKTDFERDKLLFEKGVISKKEFDLKQFELLQLEQSLKALESSISQNREVISNSNRNLKGSTIENALKESQLIRNTIQSFNQLKKEIDDWEKRYVLKSDIDGQVTFLSVWDETQTVKVGDLIFTVIPIKERSYIGKIEAPATNSGKIRVQQKVQIQLSNFPADEYGELNGSIASIKPVPNQDGNYLIDVDIDKELITSYNKKIPFRQEMKGTAKIITEDLRLIERFFYQLKNIID